MRLLAACLLTATLAAQDAVPAAPIRLDQPPTIKLPPDEQPVEIAAARYEVRVRGLLAETTATLTFRNPNPRQLAGVLEFPLPDGATVCGYALDIGGRMVDGVIVGKDQGRVIVESEQRQRIDPGLAEHVRGNAFRTAIFPLPPQGTRTVRLTWTAELTVEGDEAAARLALPRVPLPALELKVEVGAGAVEPVIGGFGNLALTRWQDRHVAEARLTDVTPGDDLLIRLPKLPERLVMVEERQGERFIAIAAKPPAVERDRAQPKRVAVAWDASGSRTPTGIARGRDALLALMKAWPGTVVDLVIFRDVAAAPVACADAAALGKALDGMVYDGGTALARLDLRRAALPDPADAAWILVGDGLGTIGSGLPATGDVPVHCLAAETVRDGAALRLIAARSGGQLVDAMAETAEAAARRIVAPPVALQRIDAADGVLADVEIGRCQDRVLITARLLGDGEIALVYGPGLVQRVAVRAADAVPGDNVARVWAGALADDLAVDQAANAERLLALGRRYGVVTAGTSLIVIERLDQYLRHRVEPPESAGDLRQQYFESIKRWRQDDELARRRTLDAVAARWQERVAWWKGHDAAPEPVTTVARRDRLLDPPVGHAAPAEPPPVARPLPAPSVHAPVATAESRRLRELAARPNAGGGVEAPIEQSTEEDRDMPRGREDAAADSEMGGDGFVGAIGAGAGAHGGLFGSRHGGVSTPDALAGANAVAVIAITPFDPDAPYLRALAAAPAGEVYSVYLRERETHRASPSFFLDCASFLLAKDPAIGHRVLSNLAELRLDDPGLMRIYAWRLQQAGDLDAAIDALRAVLRLRPEEPQSYRDLALALAARGEAGKRAADVEEAMDLLRRVVAREPLGDGTLGQPAVLDLAWNRFPDVELIALEELNRLIAVASRGGFDHAPSLPALDQRLAGNLDADVRVVMGWDQDATDIDLHVVDPRGEEAYYGHRLTVAGGLVTRDCTQGYGPEEFAIRRAAVGTFDVRCHYYGSRSTRLFGPATVVATVFTDWGRPTERRQVMTLRLDRVGQSIPVGRVQVGAHAPTPAEKAEARVTPDLVATLARGQSRDQVEAALGAPARVDGGGVTVLIYRLDGEDTVRIAFGPGLLWARAVRGGVERDLVR